MNKDMAFYSALDLDRCAEDLPEDGEQRAGSELYHDMLKSIMVKCETETITAADLLKYLGSPKSTRHVADGEVWEYEWRGQHMGRDYRGSTPFIVVGGRVTGVEREQGV